MQCTQGLTKRDLIEIIEKNFPDASLTEIIAVLVSITDPYSGSEARQQTVLFKKEIEW